MKLVRNERIRLRATFLNTIAAGFAVTGVIGPMASYLYGTTAQTTRSLSQFVVEIAVLLGSAALLHIVANIILGRLEP